MLETDLRFAGYSERRAGTVYEELLQRIEAIPGVAIRRAVARPADGDDASRRSWSTARRVRRIAGKRGVISAGPGFFETLRIPLLFGRVFDARDRADTPRVAVITDDGAAVLRHGQRGRPAIPDRRTTRTLDGSDRRRARHRHRETSTTTSSIRRAAVLPLVHTVRRAADDGHRAHAGDAAALLAAMERELRAVDATLPVVTAKTMAQKLERAQAAPKAVATLLGILGGLGLVLASIGLYAVVAFAVARRSREIGIRMALGARSQQVVWSIARGMAGLVGVGTGIGLVLSVLAMLALRASSSATSGSETSRCIGRTSTRWRCWSSPP